MSKTILITGAGSGFGKLAAFGLAKRGERVIATTQIWAQVTELRAEAKERGLEIEVDKLDVTSERDRKRAAERWDVDVLVNNAGTMEAGPVAELPFDLLRSMFEINFFGNLALTQEFAAKMVRQQSGKIIFISSVAGLMTVPFSAGYSATKHAVEALAEGLKIELAPFGIKVAVINPGFYNTGFNDRGFDAAMQWFDPAKNFTSPEALANVAQILSQQIPPEPLADLIVDVVLSDDSKFRNVLPAEIEAYIRQNQKEMWEADS
jgi:short-subunit dehydrogenase